MSNKLIVEVLVSSAVQSASALKHLNNASLQNNIQKRMNACESSQYSQMNESSDYDTSIEVLVSISFLRDS